MGPGSFDPGNNKALTFIASGPVLQWGRGLSTPEICADPDMDGFYTCASMGPGSFDPGNVGVVTG